MDQIKVSVYSLDPSSRDLHRLPTQGHLSKHHALITLGVLTVALLFQNGCSKQPDSPNSTATTPQVEALTPIVPPTVSIDAPAINLEIPEEPTVEPEQTAMLTPETEQQTPKPVEPLRAKKGSVLWLLEEIALLRRQVTESSLLSDNESANVEERIALEQQQVVRENSNRKIVELAQAVIVKTHQDPSQVNSFNTAVLALADARLDLAMNGDAEQSKLLGEDAQALYEKDPKSFAAVESAFKLLQFTQVQAQAKAAKETKWAVAYARQARLFASKFPQEQNRAAIQLVAASRICDKIGLISEAKNCLLVVEEKYPNSPFSDQVKNSLRRLRLPGEELVEFGGTTIDGQFISIEQFRGRPVIIAFWASNSLIFKEDMRLIEDILKSLESTAAVIGVNLDRDELTAKKFIGMNGNPWPHIFYSAPEKRGMENLIAKYYGVIKVPTYWLVDADGIVQTVSLKPEDLGRWLTKPK